MAKEPYKELILSTALFASPPTQSVGDQRGFGNRKPRSGQRLAAIAQREGRIRGTLFFAEFAAIEAYPAGRVHVQASLEMSARRTIDSWWKSSPPCSSSSCSWVFSSASSGCRSSCRATCHTPGGGTEIPAGSAGTRASGTDCRRNGSRFRRGRGSRRADRRGDRGGNDKRAGPPSALAVAPLALASP